jgi:hypothetical protein
MTTAEKFAVTALWFEQAVGLVGRRSEALCLPPRSEPAPTRAGFLPLSSGSCFDRSTIHGSAGFMGVGQRTSACPASLELHPFV